MIKSIEKHFLTITQAAELSGVSRQRMHQLVKLYGVPTHPVGSQNLIYRPDLDKIPANRPSGVQISKRKKK